MRTGFPALPDWAKFCRTYGAGEWTEKGGAELPGGGGGNTRGFDCPSLRLRSGPTATHGDVCGYDVSAEGDPKGGELPVGG